MTGLDTRNLLCCRCPCHRDTWRQWWTEPACHPSPYHCFLARTSSAAYHNSAPATHSHTHDTASLPTLQTLLHRLVTPTTLLHCPVYRHCFTAQFTDVSWKVTFLEKCLPEQHCHKMDVSRPLVCPMQKNPKIVFLEACKTPCTDIFMHVTTGSLIRVVCYLKNSGNSCKIGGQKSRIAQKIFCAVWWNLGAMSPIYGCDTHPIVVPYLYS